MRRSATSEDAPGTISPEAEKRRGGCCLPLVVLAGLILLPAIIWFSLTDAGPLVTAPPPPDARHADATRRVLTEIRNADAGSPIEIGQDELDGLAVLISDRLVAGQLVMDVRDDRFEGRGSYPLPAGRWINVLMSAQAQADGQAKDFALSVGGMPVPSWAALPLARMSLPHLLGDRDRTMPPVDDVLREVAIVDSRIRMVVGLPSWSPGEPGLVDGDLAAELYCRAVTDQREAPLDDFAELTARIFGYADGEVDAARFNRAAFVSLAILIVDPKAADLAGIGEKQLEECSIPLQTVLLHGRADLPRHWALSAALQVSGGTQLAEAMGEWKELSDSLTRGKQRGSGFSFVDLAADRAGFRFAQIGTDPARAGAVQRKLQRATTEMLLPSELAGGLEGMTEQQFEREFGNIRDKRYRTAVARIDSVLREKAIR